MINFEYIGGSIHVSATEKALAAALQPQLIGGARFTGIGNQRFDFFGDDDTRHSELS